MSCRSDAKEAPWGARMFIPRESDSIFSWVGDEVESEEEDDWLLRKEDLSFDEMSPPRIKGDWIEQLNLIPDGFFSLSFWVAMTKLFLSTRSNNFPSGSLTTNWEASAATAFDPIKSFAFASSFTVFLSEAFTTEFKDISWGLVIFSGLSCRHQIKNYWT